jgi:hypothetical protein
MGELSPNPSFQPTASGGGRTPTLTVIVHAYACWPLVLAAIVAALPSVAHGADQRPLPSTWWALANSVNSEDLGLVKQLRALQWFDACGEWGKGMRSSNKTRRQQALRLMLDSDKHLNEIDLQNVPLRSVAVGMNTCGVIASLGKPDDTNITTTAASTTSQLIYRRKSMYVYTEGPPRSGNGIVRAIQQ